LRRQRLLAVAPSGRRAVWPSRCSAVALFSRRAVRLWGFGASNQIGISGSAEFRNGIITFPGGGPPYKNGQLVGGIGVSGGDHVPR
jgi:uncharacterized protein GlcG (DUF336 family)